MRITLTILVALHGAIHLLGFLKWSKLATVQQLTGRTLVPLSPAGDRVFAILWLFALLALVAAAALRIARHDSWWLPALGGVALSQCLIVFAWHDARFGTIANALILVPALVAAAHTRFSQWTDSEIRTLLTQSSSAPHAVVERSELQQLPTPVRRWLEASGVVGRERAQIVRLKQRGELRTSPGAAWMPARAEQYFSVEPPAFVWRVDATMMGIVPVTGRDKYAAGHGHMLIKAASMVNVVDAADERIDHGSMLRFLGEIVWFPSAALSRYIEWEPTDERSAKATMRYGGLALSAEFTFDTEGRIAGMRADRYLGGGADAKLTPWIVTCSSWRVFQGVQVPDRGEVGWMLSSGEFTYYRWEILAVEFNRAELYDESATHRSAETQPTTRVVASHAQGAQR
jgi:hypothetical protein